MILPDKALRCVPADVRKTMGKSGQTADEAAAACVAKRESELQTQIEQMLNREGIFVVRQRMDRKSNVRLGTPDLIFSVRHQGHYSDHRPVPCAWEIKMPRQKPRPEQVAAMEAMARDGWRVAVITSYDQARLELQIARGLK